MDKEEPRAGDELNTADFPFLEDETPATAAEYSRLALQLIGKRHAPAIPLNYALFYFYVAGTNLLFNEKMDLLLGDGADWEHESAARLFMRYFTPCSDASMADLQHEMLTILNHVIDSMTGAAGTTRQRTDRLDQHLGMMRECRDPQQALQIAADILGEAQALVAESRGLESDLRSSAKKVDRLREELLHARREAATDALTGLSNRRAFDHELAKLMKRCGDAERRFSLIMMDVDHFKDVNDRHGHLIGDRVLRQLAHQVGSRTRSGDTVARYGGEEFAILLPDTRLEDAAQIAEHIREGIGKLNMRRTDTGTPIGTVTASFGVAEFHREETAQEFISRADAALYSAKRQGRNRVVSAPD